MTLTCKPGVRFTVITDDLVDMLDALLWVIRQPGVEKGLVITSVSDGVHMEGSLHYKGRALDLRSKTYTADERRIVERWLKKALPDYTLLLEYVGTPNEHWHWQPKKGTRRG